jgi:hypothetical protein
MGKCWNHGTAIAQWQAQGYAVALRPVNVTGLPVAAAKTPPPVAIGSSFLSPFYMLLSIDNTQLCCAAVSPRFLLYVHAHYGR